MEHHRTRPRLLRATADDPSTTRNLRRRCAAGELVKIRAGVWMDRTAWTAGGEVGRHLARARAVAPVLSHGAVFSHLTAAMIHGWPLVGPAPERVHVIDPSTPGVVHRQGLVIHGTPDPLPPVAPARFDGVAVTAVLPTAVHVASSTLPHVAAVAIDRAVQTRTLDRAAFIQALPGPRSRGCRRARLVASALDARHESAGESYTAVRAAEIGLPIPVPQHEFHHRDGTVDRVDFWFPSLGVVLEFDGRQKYVDPSMLRGVDPADALWREKVREDRLRALPAVRAVIRVTWWHLVELDRLRALFRAHGIAI